MTGVGWRDPHDGVGVPMTGVGWRDPHDGVGVPMTGWVEGSP